MITTGTSATKLMANLDSHYQVPKSKKQNNKFSVLVNVDVGHGISTLGMEGDEQEDKSVPGTIRESKNIQSIQNHGVERTRSTDAFQLYAHRLTACIGPADELQIRREACMSVLHLKMKAHLGPYYVYRYLPTIPDAPVPQGMSKPDDIPALVSDSSDDSSSSSGNSQAIGFGSIPPSTTIKCSITNSVFMDLSITGSLGLVPRHGHQVRKAPKPNQKSPDHYIVLMNRRSGVPIAVCALKVQSGLPIVRIYATKRRVYGQRRPLQLNNSDLIGRFSVPLYAWAEIATEGLFPDPVRFSIYMASGSEGRFSAAPSYRAGLDVADGVPKIKMVGRTDMELRETGCAIISINADPDPENDNLFFNINASQGIDPALLICFAGVMDEVMEKSMRLQCQYHSSQSQRPRRIHSRAEF